MEKPEWITGLVLVDPAARSAGFREWGEEKVGINTPNEGICLTSLLKTS